MASRPYQYQPLEEPDAIRLLSIRPAVYYHEPIRIKIVHATLREHPWYAGLSYEWNGENPWRLIDCDDSTSLMVTPNCYAAMKRLRVSKKSKTNPFLWVDAICINQADIQERNSQVSMMIDIYRSAGATLVWLGKGGSDTDHVLKFARRASFFYRHPRLKKFLLYNGVQSWNRLGTGCSFEALSSLAKCSYWTRMWTVQEFAVSSPILLWGRAERAPGGGALELIKDVFSKGSGRTRLLQYTGHLHWQHYYHVDEGEVYSLSSQYYAISRMNSTDDRDQVFALKGLFPTTLRELRVDYGRPIWDVYAEAARLAMINDGSLYLLDFVGRSHKETRLPSWAPDWSNKLSNRLYELHLFQASKRTSPKFQFAIDGKVLKLAGTLVGEISERISSIFPAFDAYSWEYVFRDGPLDYRLRNRICLRMLFDLYQEKCQASYPDFATYFRAVVRFLDPVNDLNAATQSVITHIVEGHEHLAMREIGEYGAPFISRLNGTVLFLTTDNRFGVAQEDGIQAGDRVALVAGQGSPMILRPAETGYILMSPAIISGMMDGELWPEDSSQLSQLDII